MNLIPTTQDVLQQLNQLLKNINQEEYVAPVCALSSASIGQHVRHVIEGFTCFLEGCDLGKINYDRRKRDKNLENSQSQAVESLENIGRQINTVDLNNTIILELNYNQDDEITHTVSSSAGRELVYNIEHAIHHMALIKIGVREICPHISLPENFGIAYSTIKHQKACVQ
jgi:uncharacterized damage-inducible protein DinB